MEKPEAATASSRRVATVSRICLTCLTGGVRSAGAMGETLTLSLIHIYAWRIPELTLWAFALLGGAPGGYLGMRCFRHKTRHWYFKFGFPALAVLDLTALVWLALG